MILIPCPLHCFFGLAKKNLRKIHFSSSSSFCWIVAVVLSVGNFDKSIESTFTRSIFWDKNKENDEELTKRNREREWDATDKKCIHHFFPCCRLFRCKMDKELLIKRYVISFTDKFPKCQTREDKMIFYWKRLSLTLMCAARTPQHILALKTQ